MKKKKNLTRTFHLQWQSNLNRYTKNGLLSLTAFHYLLLSSIFFTAATFNAFCETAQTFSLPPLSHPSLHSFSSPCARLYSPLPVAHSFSSSPLSALIFAFSEMIYCFLHVTHDVTREAKKTQMTHSVNLAATAGHTHALAFNCERKREMYITNRVNNFLTLFSSPSFYVHFFSLIIVKWFKWSLLSLSLFVRWMNKFSSNERQLQR